MKQYLKYIGFFNGFSEVELDQFSAVADVIPSQKDKIIINEKDEGRGIFFIVNGQFEASIKIDEKTNKTLKKLEKGEFFGEMSLLNDIKNSASIISKADGLLIFISREAFYDMCDNNPKLALKIVIRLASILAERLMFMNKKYEMAVYQAYTKH
jgi:CRP/FNR family cyclic AMP-dependent transcriptional regulator